jgi:hypothetical protein
MRRKKTESAPGQGRSSASKTTMRTASIARSAWARKPTLAEHAEAIRALYHDVVLTRIELRGHRRHAHDVSHVILAQVWQIALIERFLMPFVSPRPRTTREMAMVIGYKHPDRARLRAWAKKAARVNKAKWAAARASMPRPQIGRPDAFERFGGGVSDHDRTEARSRRQERKQSRPA